MTTKTKTVQEWLAECPTAWNMEYSEVFGRMAYFIAEDDEDQEQFLNSFTN